MKLKILTSNLLPMIGLCLVAFIATPAAYAGEHFVLKSTAFEEGATIPLKYGGNLTQITPNCIGQNVSPALSWSNPPDGTKTYALIFFDPEGFSGLGVIHWVAYGIPVSRTGFDEGEVSQMSNKFVGGKSSLGTQYYVGPCAPAGVPHHYTFILIATDLEPTALQPDLSLDELKVALKGHAKGATGLIGLYSKP